MVYFCNTSLERPRQEEHALQTGVYSESLSEIKEESILIFFSSVVVFIIGFILVICLTFYFPIGLLSEDRVSVWFSPFADCWLHV